ncbi:19171_t:CDS:1, partial [Entrophospora sp. SA101]
LIETIAHEIAHAVQSVKNVDNFTVDPEAPDVNGKPSHIRSQCESSGLGPRDEKDPSKLIKPKYPQLVAEHTKLTEEFKQMIINSPEYKEFET